MPQSLGSVLRNILIKYAREPDFYGTLSNAMQLKWSKALKMSSQYTAKIKINKTNITWKIKSNVSVRIHTHRPYMTIGSTRDPIVSSNCFENS